MANQIEPLNRATVKKKLHFSRNFIALVCEAIPYLVGGQRYVSHKESN